MTGNHLSQGSGPPEDRRRVGRKIVFSLIPGLAGILLALLIAEGALRVWHRFKPKPEEALLYIRSSNELRRFKNRPGVKLKEFGNVPVNTNSLGFRGREYPPGKGAGVRRILILGDSVTFGLFAQESKIYPNVLERLLNEEKSGLTYEVLNSGLSGYNVWNELGTLQEMGPRLEPDFVILQVCFNDFAPSNYLSALGSLGVYNWKGDYLPEESRVRTAAEFLEVHSMLFAEILLQLDHYLKKKGARKDYFAHYESFYHQIFKGEIEVPKLRKRWQEVMDTIVKIREMAEGLGAGFLMIAYHPSDLFKYDEPSGGFSDQLKALATRNGFPCIVMKSELLKRAENQRIFKDRVHLNSWGHLISAQILFEHIRGKIGAQPHLEHPQ